MSSVLETEGIPKIIRRCKAAQIPLCKIDCSYKNSRFNQFVDQWLQAHESLQSDYEALRSKSEFHKKLRRKVTPLREYRSEAPKPVSVAPSFLTTEMYKRISPEFLELLKTQSRIEKIEDGRVYPGKALSGATGSSFNNIDPNLAKYLTDVMESGGISNYVYGLNYQSKKGTPDLSISAGDYLNAFELTPILEMLKDGNAISSVQLQYLINFLNAAGQSDDYERLSTVLAMLHDHGVLTPAIADFLKNLLLQVGSSFRPSALEKLYNTFKRLSKLSQPDDKIRLQSILALLKRGDKHGPASKHPSNKNEPGSAGANVRKDQYGPDLYGPGPKGAKTTWGRSYGPGNANTRLGSYGRGGPYGPGTANRYAGPKSRAGLDRVGGINKPGGANIRAVTRGRAGPFGPETVNRRAGLDRAGGANNSGGANIRAGKYRQGSPYIPGAAIRSAGIGRVGLVNKVSGANIEEGIYGRRGPYSPGAVNRRVDSGGTGGFKTSRNANSPAVLYARRGVKKPIGGSSSAINTRGDSHVPLYKPDAANHLEGAGVNKTAKVNSRAGSYGRGSLPERNITRHSHDDHGPINPPVSSVTRESVNRGRGLDERETAKAGKDLDKRKAKSDKGKGAKSLPASNGDADTGVRGSLSRLQKVPLQVSGVNKPAEVNPRAGSYGRGSLPERNITRHSHDDHGPINPPASSVTRESVNRGRGLDGRETAKAGEDLDKRKAKPDKGKGAKSLPAVSEIALANHREANVHDEGESAIAREREKARAKAREKAHQVAMESKTRRPTSRDEKADQKSDEKANEKVDEKANETANEQERPSERGSQISKYPKRKSVSINATSTGAERVSGNISARPTLRVGKKESQSLHRKPPSRNSIETQNRVFFSAKGNTLSQPSQEISPSNRKMQFQFERSNQDVGPRRRSKPIVYKRFPSTGPEVGYFKPIDTPQVPWRSLHDFKTLAKSARISRKDRAKLNITLTRGLSYYTALNEQLAARTPRPTTPVVTDLRPLPSFLSQVQFK